MCFFFANNGDPGEVISKVSFHRGLYCLLR